MPELNEVGFSFRVLKGVPDGIKGVFEGALETNNTPHRLVTDIKKTTVISAFG